MSDLNSPLSLDTTKDNLSSDSYNEVKNPTETKAIANLENNISLTEHHSFSTLMKDLLTNLKERFSHHKLRYKQKSHYLESLFLSKVSKNSSKTKNEVSKEFQSLLELKKGERGSWIEEIVKRAEGENKDSIWEQIKTLPNITIMEQMVDLALICESNKSSELKEPLSNLLNFSLKLALLMPSKRSSKNIKTVKEAQHVIGQIIFLIEHSPSCLKQINDEDPGSILTLIHEEFSKQMQEVRADLLKYSELHKKTQLQSSETAYYHQLSLKLAERLVTEKGSINIGIIDLLMHAFISLETYPSNYEQAIIRGLKQLRDHPLIRIYLEKICAPNSSEIPSNEVIRASLRLSHNEKISDIHAKKTVIAALLSHPRQKSTDSCFATSFVIKMKDTHPLNCIEDYYALLNRGKLTRKVNGVSKDIPFLKRIEDNLDLEVEFNAKGQLILNGSEGGYIWESPGIQSACRAIGMGEVEKAVMKIVEEEFFSMEELKTKLKVKKLLKRLSAQVISEKEDVKMLSIVYAQACFAFSSEAAQPLSKVWENCIAGMAETAERSMIKSKILESFIYSLEVELNRLEVPVTVEITEFLKKAQEVLKQAIHLRYDPGLENDLLEDRKFSTLGGFVLYNQSFRIDNESYFRQFAKEVIETVHKQLSLELKEDKYKYFSEALLSYIESTGFLKNMLSKYRSKRLSKSYDELKFTPWITNSGNNSRRVMDVYFESENVIKTHSLVTTNTIEFANSLVKLGKEIYQDDKKFLANKRIAGRIHYSHALTGLFNHPLLKQAIKSSTAPQKWIEKNIIQQGLKIAHTKLGSESHQKVIEILKKDICPKFLTKKESKLFYEGLEKVSSGLTIKEYRSGVLELFKKFDFLNKVDITNISHLLDSSLCNSLDSTTKEKFLQSVLYFSDTNWSQNASDIYFCLLVNPGNGLLEIWHSQDNGECFTRINQEEWLINKEWEFFIVPSDHHSNSQIFKIYD